MQLKEELKGAFTSYWSFMTLRTACQLNVFDEVKKADNTINELSNILNTDYKSLEVLISSLIRLNTLESIDSILILKPKGDLLTDSSPDSLKQACILWGEEHLTAWQNLEYTIKTGLPSFEKIYSTSFFNYLKNDVRKLNNYHKAMSEYAVDDYRNITDVFEFSKFSNITDVGGGLGVLINYVHEKYPIKTYNLVELPEVIDLFVGLGTINLYRADFFNSIPVQSDLIILSRVLHDWDDEKAKIILKKCLQTLSINGQILIIEIMQEEINADLLSLNMMAICKSYERTFNQYEKLIKNVGLKVSKKIKLNNLQTILSIERT